MNDTEFQILATSTLEHISQALEPAYESGALDDLSLADGVLTITTATKRVFIVSKHAPTQQIWLASAFSGGLHFLFQPTKNQFQLTDGRNLHEVLRHDLAKCDIEIAL